MQNHAGVERRSPDLRANSLEELLGWSDADFVRCAYVTMLGRQPEDGGEGYYLDRIRRGHSKLQVLWELRRSPEGKAHDPGISGLDRALRRAALERRPIIGRLIRLFTNGEADDRLARIHRTMINELGVVHAQLRALAPSSSLVVPRFVSNQQMDAEDLSPDAQRSMDILVGKSV